MNRRLISKVMHCKLNTIVVTILVYNIIVQWILTGWREIRYIQEKEYQQLLLFLFKYNEYCRVQGEGKCATSRETIAAAASHMTSALLFIIAQHWANSCNFQMLQHRAQGSQSATYTEYFTCKFVLPNENLFSHMLKQVGNGSVMKVKYYPSKVLPQNVLKVRLTGM